MKIQRSRDLGAARRNRPLIWLATIVLVTAAVASATAPAATALALTPIAGDTAVRLDVDGDLYIDVTGFDGTGLHLDAARAVILGTVPAAWPIATGAEIVVADGPPITIAGDVLFAVDRHWQGGLLDASATGTILVRGLGGARLGPSSFTSAHALVFTDEVFAAPPSLLSLSAPHIHFGSADRLPDSENIGPANALVGSSPTGMPSAAPQQSIGNQGLGGITMFYVGRKVDFGVQNAGALIGKVFTPGVVEPHFIGIVGGLNGPIHSIGGVLLPLPPALGLLAAASALLLGRQRRTPRIDT